MAPKCSVLSADGNCEIKADESAVSVPFIPSQRPDDTVKISASVGLNAKNIANDVFLIQYALNKVPPIDGGPPQQMKMSGKCGEKTIKAIQNFQLKHFGFAGSTGKIEPGSQMHQKLIEISKRYQVFPTLPMDLTADAWFLAAMLEHIPYTRNCVHAAMTRILRAKTSGSDSMFGGSREERMSLLNRHFMVDSFTAPEAVLQKLYDIYGYMLSVLARPEAYITLDTDDSGDGISTVAFARLGGFFSKDLTGKIWLRRGAYLATGIQEFAAFIFIHELRHYVEREGDIGHHGKGWVTDQTIQKLLPSQRIYNCDSFAGFALEAKNGIMDRPGWVKSTVFR